MRSGRPWPWGASATLSLDQLQDSRGRKLSVCLYSSNAQPLGKPDSEGIRHLSLVIFYQLFVYVKFLSSFKKSKYFFNFLK